MNATTRDSGNDASAREVRLDRLLGRQVHARNNTRVGRIEEFRAEQSRDRWVVTEYVIGRMGLLERLHVGFTLLLGGRRQGYAARWDQIDISDPAHPRLLCAVEELGSL